MAFLGFGKNKKEDALTSQPKAGKTERKGAKQDKKEGKTSTAATEMKMLSSAADALIAPRITEKATDLSQYDNAYVFDVLPGATKQEIASAVKERYGVTPVKVRTIRVPHKRRFSRGKWATIGGGKKALVYLKDGDTIQIS